VHTISPSRLVPEEEFAPVDDEIWLEIEPELSPTRIENPATRYGVWWHDFAQRIPWLDDPADWDAVFAVQQVTSPDKARSAREWRLLRQKINTISDFMIGWENGSPVVRTEMPFFWKMGNDRCLEGVIDLAFFDQISSEWLIVDWKTNRITPAKIEFLRAQYRPQLASYCQVVMQTTKHPVRAALYSTVTGEFAYYSASEIAEEWERLEDLPPERFLFESGTHSGEGQLF
jgi:ATP-dependent exoDNAse (exonuclease V) beta subunit